MLRQSGGPCAAIQASQSRIGIGCPPYLTSLSGISTSEDRRRIARGEAVGELGIEAPIIGRSLIMSLSRSAGQLCLCRLSIEGRVFDTLVVHGLGLKFVGIRRSTCSHVVPHEVRRAMVMR